MTACAVRDRLSKEDRTGEPSGGKLVVLYFWSERCGPCRLVSVVVEEAARAYQKYVEFQKIDIDADSDALAKFNVQQIPTLILCRSDQILGRKTGAVSRSQLSGWLERFTAPQQA